MDAFLNSTSALCQTLLPIAGVVVLVVLVRLIVSLTKIVDKLGTTVDKTNDAIDQVDDSIDKLQAPLDTVVKISHTIDKANDAAVEAAKNAKDFVVKNIDTAKDKVGSLLNDGEEIDELKEPSPEDLIENKTKKKKSKKNGK